MTTDPTRSATGLDDVIKRLRQLAAELHNGPDRPGGPSIVTWAAQVSEELDEASEDVRRWAESLGEEAA